MKYLLVVLLLFNSLAWGYYDDKILDTNSNGYGEDSLYIDMSSAELKLEYYYTANCYIDTYGNWEIEIGDITKGFSINGATFLVAEGDVIKIDPPDQNGIRKVTIESVK